MSKEFLTQEEINRFVDTYAKIQDLIECFGAEVFGHGHGWSFKGNDEIALETDEGDPAFMSICFASIWPDGEFGSVSTYAFLSQEQWDAAVQSEKDHQLDVKLDELSDKFRDISDEDLKLWVEHNGIAIKETN